MVALGKVLESWPPGTPPPPELASAVRLRHAQCARPA